MSDLGALGRVLLVRDKLKIDDSAYDDSIKIALRAATVALENETGRKLIFQTYTLERYTAYDYQNRLYLRNWPVITLSALKFGSTTLDSNTYELIDAQDNPFILFPSNVDIFDPQLGKYPTGTAFISVTYTAGYRNTGWDTEDLTIPSGSTWDVPADIEEAVTEYAAIIVERKMRGIARGLASISRGAYETYSKETFIEGYPQVFQSVLERYRKVI